MRAWFERRTPSARLQLSIATVALVAAGLTILASVVRLPHTTFDAEVRASAVDLWLAQPTSILPRLRLTELTVGEIARVDGAPASRTESGGEDGATVDIVAATGGQIVLHDLPLSRGSHVHLEWVGLPKRYRLTVFCGATCPTRDLHFSLVGPDTLSLGSAPPSIQPAGTPRDLVLRTGNAPLTMDFAVATVLDGRSLAPYAIDSVGFEREERTLKEGGGVNSRELSSVINGRVSFASVPGATREVRQNEALAIHGRRLDVRLLQLVGDTLVAGLSGEGDALVSGLAGARWSIVPTYLEFVVANPLLRAIVLAVTAVIAWLASYYRFRSSVEHEKNT